MPPSCGHRKGQARERLPFGYFRVAPETMKILIVESNVQMRALIRRVIAGLAEVIEECGDAADIAQRTATAADWALISLAPQQAVGGTATERIKSLNAATRIVWLVDCEDDETCEAGRRAGVYACVSKEKLLALRHLLSGNSETPDAD